MFQGLDSIKYNERYLSETVSKEVTVTAKAILEDIKTGKASFIGEEIQKQHIIQPVGILFDQVARIDPADPESSKVGLGRFHAEIWILSWFGIDFTHFTKPQLVATRFLFDALFPFVLLFLISFITKPVEKIHLDRFFAKMHTPVQKTKEEEEKALQKSYNNPDKFEKEKLFPGSNWEIMKPKKIDYLGFGGSWILVGLVIVLLWVVVSIK